MEIHYLNQSEHGRTRALYEEVFVEDESDFVDAYYQIKAADNEILVAEAEGRIVSMLHRNPYTLCYRGELIAADYLVAVATQVSYRHKGLMRALLTKALKDMQAQKKPFTFLMPADEAIYTPFDFRLMGNEDEESLTVQTAEELSETYDLYVEKDALYRKRHIDWPEWEATPMMLRLLYLPGFLNRIGAAEEQSLTIAIEDSILEENNGVFLWKFTQEGSTLMPVAEEPELRISIADLGSFLCGMLGPEELPAIHSLDNSAEVIQKLAQIQVLDGIYINETV